MWESPQQRPLERVTTDLACLRAGLRRRRSPIEAIQSWGQYSDVLLSAMRLPRTPPIRVPSSSPDKTLQNTELPRKGFRLLSACDFFGFGFRLGGVDDHFHSIFHRIFEGHFDSKQTLLIGCFGFVWFHWPA